MSWLKKIMQFKNAKEIPELTDFLVGSKTFRKIVINSHHEKKSVFTKIDQYLERQLLREDVPKERWLDNNKKK